MEKLPQINEARNLRSKLQWEGRVETPLTVDWLFIMLKVAGGLYLAFLGLSIWRSAHVPLVFDETIQQADPSIRGSFFLGFVTQIANPKTAVVYASIFAALLPANPPSSIVFILPPAVFLIEAGWYSMVAMTFSATRPRRVYLEGKVWFDRIAGAVLGYLGLRLIIDNFR